MTMDTRQVERATSVLQRAARTVGPAQVPQVQADDGRARLQKVAWVKLERARLDAELAAIEEEIEVGDLEEQIAVWRLRRGNQTAT
jgi:hypothetical protein